ncbi:uncharacterized protein LOC111112079 [Crassostrea virginica]
MAGMVLLVYCGWTVLLCLSVQAYENLALHQPAWQSSTAWTYTADLAVDGQYTDLAWVGGQCAVSNDIQTTAEWRVDLGAVRNEDNGFTRFFLGFSVYISNTTNKEDGVLCFRDTNYTNATIPNPVNITCPYHGRYVIYYNNRTHPPYPEGYSMYTNTDLCEVEVYGCPSPGYYGENCSLECPQNCQDGYCDVMEGTCLGCAHRYIGPTCDDCPSGLYGSNCSQNCSMTCGDPGECDMRTGHCNGGCQVGWTGAMCEKGYHLTINNTHENLAEKRLMDYPAVILGELSNYRAVTLSYIHPMELSDYRAAILSNCNPKERSNYSDG